MANYYFNSDQSHYVELAYLKYTFYVEGIIHTRTFSFIVLYFEHVSVKCGYYENSAIYRSVFSFLKISCVKAKFVRSKLDNFNDKVIDLNYIKQLPLIEPIIIH